MEKQHSKGERNSQAPKKRRPNKNFGRFIGDLAAHDVTQQALDEFYQFGAEVEWDKTLPDRLVAPVVSVQQEIVTAQRRETPVPRIVTIYSPREENDVTIVDFRGGENECFS